MSTFAWTDVRVELLRKLWDEGLSGNIIAGRLTAETEGGGTCTRSAIIGKIHRLGLSGRIKPATVSIVPPKHRPPIRIPLERRLKPQPLPTVPLVEPDHSQTVDFLDLKAHHCRWPIGDVPPFRFCGQCRENLDNPSRMYCAYHAGIAYSGGSSVKEAA